VVAALTLSRDEAAELCGVSASGFDVWVRKGIVPGPVKGTRRWSRAALERALSGMIAANDEGPDAAYRRWKQQHAG
jgi:predicted site-specific integrase-resolvase